MSTVLVADDEFAVLEVLSMALESEGHRVLKAGDGADALRILVRQPCDLVVCDEIMPVLGGVQLIEAMRADPRLAAIPVILIVDRWGRPQGPVAHDHVHVLPKPVKLAQLFELVARSARAT